MGIAELRSHGCWAEAHDLGKVYGADTGFKLRDETVRVPDVAFVRKERLAAVHGKGFGKGAPDLAVEIFSPSDSGRQLMRKVKQYFEYLPALERILAGLRLAGLPE